ncbi:hypothetical protein RirG_086200 [Rhizophagus irregularis DAOM 197198w]|uniref:Uncharacterized protein n=1 Tax=Rhizophagus irregularis (strain DAOM 197198w) TaxID=1432141 RepID=A0A015JM25_RHIIW|nr:hypothetical protein RirG_086200 [Rhizophagus irregularis DAOM 197198w]
MKVTLFITTFLAAASLGLALPQSPPTPSNVTAHSTSKGLPQIEQILADVPGGVLGDLSQKCQSALLGLVTDPKFLKCIPIASLVPLLPLCSDPDVAGAIKIIQDGCKEDLDKKTVFYSPIHDIMCFQFDKAFCWDESILKAIVNTFLNFITAIKS